MVALIMLHSGHYFIVILQLLFHWIDDLLANYYILAKEPRGCSENSVDIHSWSSNTIRRQQVLRVAASWGCYETYKGHFLYDITF